MYDPEHEPHAGSLAVNIDNRRLRRLRSSIRGVIRNLDESKRQNYNAARQVEMQLKDLAFLAISAATQDNRPGRGRRPIDRAALVRWVVGRLAREQDLQCSIHRLAKESLVSERSLRRIFKEQYGVSPSEYVRLLKLRCVRHDLQAADAQSITVTEIFQKHGISEFGRMAGFYREVFGEIPSHTIRRS